MPDANKISGLYKRVSLLHSGPEPHILDKYDSEAAKESQKRSLKKFKNILLKELGKKN